MKVYKIQSLILEACMNRKLQSVMMTTIKHRKLTDPIMWTHGLFCVNSWLYYSSGYLILFIFLFFNTIFSSLHHYYHEEDKVWKLMDEINCKVSLAGIFWFTLKCCSLMEIGICILWLLISLVILEMGNIYDYRIFHSLWHFMVFGGNLIVWSYLPLH